MTAILLSMERKSEYVQTSGEKDVLMSVRWGRTKKIAAPLTDEQMGLTLLLKNSPFIHLFRLAVPHRITRRRNCCLRHLCRLLPLPSPSDALETYILKGSQWQSQHLGRKNFLFNDLEFLGEINVGA